jgi:hypothetical protein
MKSPALHFPRQHRANDYQQDGISDDPGKVCVQKGNLFFRVNRIGPWRIAAAPDSNQKANGIAMDTRRQYCCLVYGDCPDPGSDPFSFFGAKFNALHATEGAV